MICFIDYIRQIENINLLSYFDTLDNMTTILSCLPTFSETDFWDKRYYSCM